MEENWKQLVEAAGKAHFSLREFREMAEAKYIEYSLKQEVGNQCQTAKRIGVHRNTLGRRLDKFDISCWNFRVVS